MRALPSTVFKGVPAEFAAAFLSGDAVRIGTLGDFRKEEKHQAMIGDRLDGGAETTINLENVDIEDVHRLTSSQVTGFVFAPEFHFAGATFRNVKVSRLATDSFVFCTSLSSTADLPYGKTFELLDVHAVAVAISTALRKRALSTGRWWIDSVFYEPASTDFPDPLRLTPVTAFSKDVAFSRQEEYRMVFEPSLETIKPEILPVKWPTGTVITCR